MFSRGEAAVRLVDGAILTATVHFKFPRGRASEEAVLTIEYGDMADIPVLVPLRMVEKHHRASGEAVYSNYRRFQTSSRIR